MITAISYSGVIPISAGTITPTLVYKINNGFIGNITNISIEPIDKITPYSLVLYKSVSGTPAPIPFFNKNLLAGYSVSIGSQMFLNASEGIYGYCSVANHAQIIIDGILGKQGEFISSGSGGSGIQVFDETGALVEQTNTAIPLTNSHVFVGNASNVATDVAVSGDISIDNTGAITVITANGGDAIFTDAVNSITSAELRTSLTDETGTGVAVFADTPTLITPELGVAKATTINKVAITAPVASATLTIANTKTLTVNSNITLATSSAYTPTNVSVDRSYDANATTVDELADVLGTLLSDLQAQGIIG